MELQKAKQWKARNLRVLKQWKSYKKSKNYEMTRKEYKSHLKNFESLNFCGALNRFYGMAAWIVDSDFKVQTLPFYMACALLTLLF